MLKAVIVYGVRCVSEWWLEGATVSKFFDSLPFCTGPIPDSTFVVPMVPFLQYYWNVKVSCLL